MSRSRLQTLAGFLIALTLWLLTRHVAAAIAAGIALVFSALAWFAPQLFAPIQRGVDALVHALATAVSWVMLAIVYFGVFTPLRCWRALRGNDALRLRREPNRTTYLISPSKPSSFTRQF